MIENVNEVAVLVSALLAMAIGSIWYSPLLFGKYWMRAAGLTEADLEVPKTKMLKQLGFGFVGNFITLYVLAQFVTLSSLTGAGIVSIALLLSIFLASVMSAAVIWEGKPVSYLCINAGYAATVVFGGMAIISYWPW